MTKTILAVDPGKNDCGYAVFVDGVLTKAGLIKGEGPIDTADQLRNVLKNETLHEVVVESQQIYRVSKGDPNDMIDVAHNAGAVGGLYAHLPVHLIKPRTWTLGIPKEKRQKIFLTDHPEVAKFLKGPKAKLHNVVDAISLGYWFLGQK
jgi:Holliday junction resolvasome RuvABC endonuclease subunit